MTRAFARNATSDVGASPSRAHHPICSTLPLDRDRRLFRVLGRCVRDVDGDQLIVDFWPILVAVEPQRTGVRG
jgi:hypothetical protein